MALMLELDNFDDRELTVYHAGEILKIAISSVKTVRETHYKIKIAVIGPRSFQVIRQNAKKVKPFE